MKRESLSRWAKLFENMADTIVEEVKNTDLECDDNHRKEAIAIVENDLSLAVDSVQSIAEQGGNMVILPNDADDAAYYAKITLEGVKKDVLANLTAEQADFVRENLDEAINYLALFCEKSENTDADE